MSSKCKNCGENCGETGNYTFRIIPAKRIPKKARKLMKSGKLNGTSCVDNTSFQIFLQKRAKPSNHIEITCGRCGAGSKIRMQKSVTETTTETTETKIGVCNAPEIEKVSKKRKKSRDKTAGLNLPPKITSVDLTEGQRHSDSNPSSSGSSRNQIAVKINPRKNVPGQKSKSIFQKQKDMDKLQKILFDSKKAKKSSSSLQDFLSGI